MEVVFEALDRESPNCNVMITRAIEELELMLEENNHEGFEGTLPLKTLRIWEPFPGANINPIRKQFEKTIFF